MRMRGSRVWLACLALVACEREAHVDDPAGNGLELMETPSRHHAQVDDTSEVTRADEQHDGDEEHDREEREGSSSADDGSSSGEDDDSIEPQAPLDYGLIAPSDAPPDPSALVLHGLAGYEVVAVYDKPDIESTRLGYLRIGQRVRVTEKIEGEGCRKGFHQLAHGGYVCASKGLVVGEEPPYMYRPPPSPKVDAPLPYDYAFVKRWNTPQWWRIPSSSEWTLAEDQRTILEAERTGEPLNGEEPESVDASSSADASNDKLTKLPSVTDVEAPETESGSAEPESVEPTTPAAEPEHVEDEEPKPEVKLPLNPADPWLERGFFLSLGERLEEGGKMWWKTARGGYVQSNAVYEYKAKDFSGVVLDETTTFPFGWAMPKNSARIYVLNENGKLKPNGKVERRTFLDLAEEIEIDGKAYFLTTDGNVIQKDVMRLAEPQARPEGVEPWERWIDVSLDKQMLVAYEGDRPVYVTLVSTGRRGSKEEPFETPKGQWRIRSKHISSTMDGNTASDGNYSIQDVPWAMFFEGSYALHGAFWHESFGRVRSHGCVNLGPSDARWLFYWTTPFLPEGWHGVHAHEGSPGTLVIVR